MLRSSPSQQCHVGLATGRESFALIVFRWWMELFGFVGKRETALPRHKQGKGMVAPRRHVEVEARAEKAIPVTIIRRRI